MKCWFCEPAFKVGSGSMVPREERQDGPLCDECRATTTGFRRWLRERCSTLEPV